MFDIHIHALFDVDDGAKTIEEMYLMIDAAYADGVRYICFTPHFHLGYFKDNVKKRDAAFEEALKYSSQKYPDLILMLGNELRFSQGCVAYLTDGQCKTMNNTKYVLVDFSEIESSRAISDGLDTLLSAGYLPILAHAERYRSIWGNLKLISNYRSRGVKIQIDSQSLTGEFGYKIKFFAMSILKNRLADFISSDAHDVNQRPPGISKAFEIIEKKCSRNYAESICYTEALKHIGRQAL